MNLSAIQMLERLVAFPTVSANSNLDLIGFVKDYLAAHGVAATVVPDETGEKAALFATIGPMVEGGIILSGHTDVVPAEEDTWVSSPWTLTARDGRLYGRGSADMKGFDALVLAAVPEMVKRDLKAPIHIALSYDEEIGCRGVQPMIDRMGLTIPQPRAVIVGEPSMMLPVNGHKGSTAFYTDVTGYAVHSSRIDIGVSAVMVAARLIGWLEARMEKAAREADPDSLFVPPYTTVHCGMIEGGTAANIVADHCRFITDIRVVPPDDAAAIIAEYEAFIRETVEPGMKAKWAGAGIAIERRSHVPPLMPEPGSEAERLVAELGVNASPGVVAFGTEGGMFREAGWPTIICGPGDIAVAHKANEYIEESQMVAGERFMSRLIDRLSA